MRASLAAYHEETHFKLDLAPVDSSPIYQRKADGWLCRVDEDGWLSEPGPDLDESGAIGETSVGFGDTEIFARHEFNFALGVQYSSASPDKLVSLSTRDWSLATGRDHPCSLNDADSPSR